MIELTQQITILVMITSANTLDISKVVFSTKAPYTLVQKNFTLQNPHYEETDLITTADLPHSVANANYQLRNTRNLVLCGPGYLA